VPAAARARAVGIERDHGLQDDMRVEPAVRETEPPLADLLEEQLRDRVLADEVAGRVVADCVRGEEIGEVVPQPEFRVVAVRVLEPLDRADRLRLLDASLEPVDTLVEHGDPARALGARGRAPDRGRGEQRRGRR
jgi:hypothetical protein